MVTMECNITRIDEEAMTRTARFHAMRNIFVEMGVFPVKKP